MKLCSCDNCGVMLDQDKLPFSHNIEREDGIDEKVGAYNFNTEKYEAYVSCPVCKARVFKDES